MSFSQKRFDRPAFGQLTHDKYELDWQVMLCLYINMIITHAD
jgi:hypothetical protein